MLALLTSELIIVMQHRFGRCLDAGNRCPQLMRRICQESPSAFFCLLRPRLRALELVEHFVERLRGLAKFGVRTGRRQSVATVALANALGERSHRVKWPQGDPNCRCDQHSADS